MVKTDQNRIIIPLIIAVGIVIATLVLSFGASELKRLQAKVDQNKCQKQISQDINVCESKNNNMLFVGCNGFF